MSDSNLRMSVSKPGGSLWREVRQLFSSACGAFIEPLPMARHWLATIRMALTSSNSLGGFSVAREGALTLLLLLFFYFKAFHGN